MPPQPLADHALAHGWIHPFPHPRLGVTANGQSAVRYLRFGRPVAIEHLELKPLVYGRWVPAVPTHPAHLTISTLDAEAGRWRLVREVDLPPHPATAGEGLSQAKSIEDMEDRLSRGLDTTHHIDLGSVSTQALRVECDREHPCWPNHGECNGGPYNVPFGILNTLKAFGEVGESAPHPPPYFPPLTVESVRPRAPRGMKVDLRSGMVYFEGRHLAVGFSLRRPLLKHLGWNGADDGADGGRALINRLAVSQAQPTGAGFPLSGPLLRTFTSDRGPHTWCGRVSVNGNRVVYRDLQCGEGVALDAAFVIEPERIVLELAQTCEYRMPLLEAEAWRLAWNVSAGMTGAFAVPTLRPGRNGDVDLPMLWASDGGGCLSCARLDGSPELARLQVESYRANLCVTGGIMQAERADQETCLTLPAGRVASTWEWRVTNLGPRTRKSPQTRGAAIRRHWASVYTCYRPEYGGFSNNAVSVNCHVNQHCPAELVAFTQQPAGGPDPLALFRFTISRALLDGGGYGYCRNLYLDADPILLCAAGRVYQAGRDADWLKAIEPGLLETAERVLVTLGDEGLAICRDLSGNTGSFRWSSNAMDVVGFGHLDAYVNAWTYRGLRNAAAMIGALGRAALAKQCNQAADRLRTSFPERLVNPDTGWVAGWRSRDGALHDAAYLFVNGVALAFGLLDRPAARRALRGLERLRHEVGAGDARFGIPFNLKPIPAGDHMLPRIMGPLSPTFEHYTDGAMAPGGATYYLRALQIYGLKEAAQQIAADLEEGYTRGHFTGGVGSGVEFYRWDGAPTGYEGTFVASFGPLYAIAIGRGLFRPTRPEWWPE